MRRTFLRSLMSLTAAITLTWAGVGHVMASSTPQRSGVSLMTAKTMPAVEVVELGAHPVEEPAASEPTIDVGFATSSAVAVATSAASAPMTTTAPSTPTTPVTPAPVTTASPASPQISSARLRFGLGAPGGLYDASELPAVESAVGEVPSVILAYSDFTQAAPIVGLDAVSSRGQLPMLTWEPWQAGGADQSKYSLSHIVSGDYDTYIRSWATALKSWGKPVMLRFAHEMNGNWYPWSEQVNGNQPGQYVAAWRHVHDIFTAVGDHNVLWVWSPNVAYTGSTALSELYPGPGYVDVVAMDGYNWGNTRSDSVWTSPADLFGPTLAELRGIAPGLPVVIGETASAESGGSKSDWITSLVSYLEAQPDVTALVWFDYDKEADWRINSSDASIASFRAALAARR